MLASLHKLTKTKHNTDEAIPLARLQKSQHKYIVSKRFSGLETFPNNRRVVGIRMSWVEKNRKIN